MFLKLEIFFISVPKYDLFCALTWHASLPSAGSPTSLSSIHPSMCLLVHLSIGLHADLEMESVIQDNAWVADPLNHYSLSSGRQQKKNLPLSVLHSLTKATLSPLCCDFTLCDTNTTHLWTCRSSLKLWIQLNLLLLFLPKKPHFLLLYFKRTFTTFHST